MCLYMYDSIHVHGIHTNVTVSHKYRELYSKQLNNNIHPQVSIGLPSYWATIRSSSCLSTTNSSLTGSISCCRVAMQVMQEAAL